LYLKIVLALDESPAAGNGELSSALSVNHSGIRPNLPLLRVRSILACLKPTLTPQQFANTWANVRLKESSAYVTHFDDLCELVGHPKPAHMDQTGTTFTYQKGARKEEAGEIVGNGFAVEYKTARQHKTLTEAFKQLQQYGGALKNPRKSHVAAKRPSQIG
jgi:hypothetical protein